MICPNCGRDIPDGTVCPCTLQPVQLSDNPALNAVKTMGSSPLFLVMAIMFSLTTLFTIFSSLGLNDTIYNLYYAGYSMGMDQDTIDYLVEAIRSTSVFSAVFSAIPAILIAVAMWMHYLTCRNRMNGNISTAGLTICKVIAYINMIGQCLAALAVVGLCALVIVALLGDTIPWAALGVLYDVEKDELMITIIVVLSLFLAFFLFMMVLAITYQASIIRMINRTKAVSQTGMADERVPSYLVGMTYLTAVCCLITGVSALFTSPIGGLGAVCRGVAYILMAMLLGRYRKAMNSVMYPPVNPMGGYGWTPQPGYAPQSNMYMPQGQPQAPYAPQPGPADGFQAPQPNNPNQPPMQ